MTDRPTFKDHDYFMKDKTDYTSRKVFEEHVRHTNDQTRLLRDNTKELQAQTEVLHQEMRDYHGELDDVIEGNLIQTKVDERVEQKYNDLDQAYNTQLNRLTQKLTRTNDKIGKIGSGKPSGAFPNVGDLERAYPNGDGGNIYVVSEDNHWYYWNGSAWIAGGLYNATVSDEFPATNLIVNGNFSKGTVNWGSQFTTITAANNVLTATATGQLPFARVFSHTGNRNIKGVTGKKIYARSLQRINDDSCVSMNFVLQNTTVKYDTFKMVNNPENSKWYDMSAIITLPQSVDGIDVGVAFHADYASKEIALGKTMNIKDVIVIDLTETFGSGNEPNKEEMDNILSHYSNKWFDGTTSPFVKLKYVYNKINTLTLPTVSDEFPATNLIVNGNFSKGTVNWGSQFTTITAANNVLTATATGQLPFARVFSHTGNRNIKGVTGKKIYARSLQRINDDSCVSMNFVLQNTTVKYDTFKMVNNPENSKWYDMSAIITLPQSVDGIDVGVAFHADYASKEIALGKTMNIKDVIVIDLTETFGSGNEPNKEEMDNILSHYSNKWFDGTTSPFVKLKYVYNKINTLTLPTVDTDTIKYNSKLWGLTGLKYCAHRGYSGIAPENSIPSFELAGENGFWSIEIDLGLTSDNKIIIMHDSTVDRTTNGTGLVRNLTLAQIKEFNIDTGANIGLYPNLKVPTLEEYLTVCRKWRAVPNIHIDQFAVDGVGVEYNLLYQTLVNYGFEKTAIVSASGLNRLRAMRALSKDLHLLYFTGFLSVREINKALEIENCSIGYNYLNGDLVQSAVNYAHQKGIHVNGFTINNATLRDDILVKGVDLITTDSLLPPKHQN